MATWDVTPNGVYTPTTAIRTSLNSAEWSVVITPTNALSSYSGYNALVANGDGGLWIVNSQIQIFRNEDAGAAAVVDTGTVVNTAGNPFTLTIRPVTRQLVVAGLSGAGNGTYSWVGSAPTTIIATGGVGIGRYSDGSSYTFAGSLSDITYTAASNVLTADSVARTITPTSANLRTARKISAASVGFAITPSSAGIVGPTTYKIVAASTSFAVSATAATLSRTRTMVAQSVSYAVTPTNATLSVPAGLALGVHGISVQRYGHGSNPNTVTLTTTTGNTFLVFVAGLIADIDNGPTDNKGNTYTLLDQVRQYTSPNGNWGTAVYICRNGVGGSSHVFSQFVTSEDESTMVVVEVSGVNRVQPVAWNQTSNPGSGTNTSNNVTTTDDALMLAAWWGAAPTGQDHTAVPNNGFSVIESYLTDHPDGYIQTAIAQRIQTTPGTYNVTWTNTPSQGAQMWLIALQEQLRLTADAASFAITPTNAALKVGKRIVASSTSFAITPSSATLVRGRAIVAASAAFAITPTAAGLRVSRKIAAASTSFSVTATSANLRYGRRIVAATVGYAITPTAAALKYNRRIVASSVAFAFTPTNAAISTATGAEIVADSVGYAITPTAASLRVGRKVSAASVTFSIAPTVATLSGGKSVGAGSATFAIAPTNMTMRRSRVVLASTVGYGVFPNQANLTWSAQEIPRVEVGEPAATVTYDYVPGTVVVDPD